MMGASARRHATTYGWRAKIGVIVPPTNTVNEAEWNIMAPEGVTIHSTRMALHLDTESEAGRKALYADIEKAVKDLAAAGPDSIAYGCTAGSMVNPPSSLPDHMSKVCGLPCVTTAASIVQALRALGVFRIALVSPYHEALNRHEAAFLAANGVETLHMAGLDIGANGPSDFPRIAKTPQDVILDLARNANVPPAQAMLIACTDFPVMGLIEQLEEEFGKPVITSNQATFWTALRAAGIEDRLDGYGRLLREF
ncbi:MAG: aspartate/glutamate racemase family protein [Beijerinckiaceae bacterium]